MRLSMAMQIGSTMLGRLVAAGSTLLQGLVSYWPLNEQSGTRADAVGSNDLTDNNTVLAVNRGPSGVVASFVAANSEYLSKTSFAEPGTIWSLSGWFKTTDGVNDAIFSFADGASETMRLTIQSGVMYFVVDSSNTTAQAITNGLWYFAVAWCDGTKIYLSLNNAAAQEATDSLPAGTDLFTIGKDVSNRYMDGPIGGVGYWSRVLTAGERTSLFNSGNGKTYADLTAGEKTGLVSYWNLDEASGTRIDSHGSNDLTDNNTVLAVNRGPSGVVAKFVEANTESLSRAAFVTPDFFTLSIWARRETTGTAYPQLIGCGAGWPTTTQFTIYTNGGILNTVESDDAGAFNQALGGVVPLGQWQHIVLTYDTDKKMRVYQDGILTGTSQALASAAYRTAQSLHIGGAGDHGTVGNSNYAVGPTGIWSRVFDAGEIDALRASGNGKRYADLTAGEKTGLVSYWDLSETSGTRYDSHGANDLTDNNTVGSVVNAGGAMDGAAASFVSANSETLSAAGAFDSSQPYTFAFWVNGADTIANGIIWINGNTSTYLLINGAIATWYHEKSGGFSSIGHQSTISAGWHLLICEMDGSALNYYMDNVASVSNPVACVSPTQSGAVPFALGGYVGYMTTSRIDEPAIWSRVLTAGERAELWNSGAGRFYPFPVGG